MLFQHIAKINECSQLVDELFNHMTLGLGDSYDWELDLMKRIMTILIESNVDVITMNKRNEIIKRLADAAFDDDRLATMMKEAEYHYYHPARKAGE